MYGGSGRPARVTHSHLVYLLNLLLQAAANLNEQKSIIYTTTTADAEQYVPGSPEVPPKLPEALLELLGVALEPPEAEPHARVQPEVGQLVLWPLEVGLWLPEVAAGQPGFAPGDSEVRPRGRSGRHKADHLGNRYCIQSDTVPTEYNTGFPNDQPYGAQTDHEAELQNLQEQIQAAQQQLQEAKAQLQAAKERAAQLQAAREREAQLQEARERLQEVQAELQAALAELRETQERIAQHQQ